MTRIYKQGTDRMETAQLPARIEDYVGTDNPVRAIDVYVDTLELGALGFDRTQSNLTAAGQPAFSPIVMLKIYLYGYLNRLRSSRALARECLRNLEMMWLTQGLAPGYKTIADFRKRNPQALRLVHKGFIALCKALELLGGERVAVDGSHFNGNVSDKSFRTVMGLNQGIEKLDARINEWLQQMDQADREDDTGPPAHDPALVEKLERLKALKAAKEAELKRLEASGQTQCSMTDPDARLLSKGGQTVAGYNVQIVVDVKHKLIVADEVVQDGNDLNQLHPMLSQAKEALGVDHLEGLADAGYFNVSQIVQCEQNGIVVYVPEPERYGRQRKQGRFTRNDFQYVPEEDLYRCPQGNALAPSGQPKEQSGSTIQRYRGATADCRDCPLRNQCIGVNTDRREILRNEHESVLETHRQRMENNPGTAVQRSSTVEHPFGTLKCRAGWVHFLLRGLEKVRGEWSLMALAYNFTRVLNILGINRFMDYCAQNMAVCA
jgi:transposase